MVNIILQLRHPPIVQFFLHFGMSNQWLLFQKLLSAVPEVCDPRMKDIAVDGEHLGIELSGFEDSTSTKKDKHDHDADIVWDVDLGNISSGILR